MKIAEILRGAADVIRDQGWTRKVLVNQSGEVCALGAINTMVSGSACYPYPGTTSRVTVEAVAAVLADRLERAVWPRGTSDINEVVFWNNSPECTADEVVGLFDSVADELDFQDALDFHYVPEPCDIHEPCTVTARCRVHVAPVTEASITIGALR